MKKILFIFSLLLAFSVSAQETQDTVVEITGVVVTKDAQKNFIPYAHLTIPKRSQVTISDEEGFFSFAAVPNDTIIITCVGFKTTFLWVPDTLDQETYLS
jgi:hypothetical protein